MSTTREINNDTEILSVPLIEFRFDATGGKPKVIGHASVFDSLSEDLGGFREIVKPGAFAKSLKSDDVVLLINHEGLPLARNKSGTLRMEEDAKGLRIESDLDPTDPDVMRLIPKMNRGDLKHMSFGFRTITDSWRTDGGKEIRELHQVQLFDVSIVTSPAYRKTSVALRSLEAHRQATGWKPTPLGILERQLRTIE
jgi:HK97 family phage prohead protease